MNLNRIDALRGFACLLVVGYHARAEFWTGLSSLYQSGEIWSFNAFIGYFSAPLSFGWIGVHLFFVLSGYCIHRSGLRYRIAGQNLPVAEFYGRRFTRIYPVLIYALAFTAALYVVQINLGVPPQGDVSWPVLFANLLALQSIAAPHFGINGVFWTLAIELHLYAFYPVFFVFIRKFGPTITLLTCAAVSLIYGVVESVLWSDLFTYATHGSPIFLSYLFIWSVGACLAEAEELNFLPCIRGLVPSVIICLLLCAGLLTVRLMPSSHLAYTMATLPIGVGLGGLLLMVLALNDDRLAETPYAVSIRFLSFAGLLSYSLYATHAVTFGFLHLSPLFDAQESSSVWISASAVSFLVAMAAYFSIEEPFTRLRKRPTRAVFLSADQSVK